MKNKASSLIALAALFFVSLGCMDLPAPEQRPLANTERVWKYTEEIDPMTSKPEKFAVIESNNVLNFDFPYQGGSTGTLTIRRKDKKDEVMLSISKGQILSDSRGGRRAALRFDERKPFEVFINQPSDYSSTTVFLENPNKIIAELKKSTKLIIEIEFYREGNRILEFSVKDFKWQ